MGNTNLLEEIGNIPLFESVDVYSRRGEKDPVEQNHFQGIVEEGEDDVIAIPTERYNLVQIRDVFREALQTVEEAAKKQYGDIEADGDVFYHRGRGELEIFLDDDDESEVGLLVRNSVDGSYALCVDFVTKVNGESIIVPKVEAFQRYHSANEVEVEVGEYFQLLSKVSKAWKEIATELGEKKLTTKNIENLSEELSLGKKFDEKIEKYTGNGYFSPLRFWEFVQMALQHIQRGKYSSKVHRRKKVRKTADTIMNWAIAEVL